MKQNLLKLAGIFSVITGGIYLVASTTAFKEGLRYDVSTVITLVAGIVILLSGIVGLIKQDYASRILVAILGAVAMACNIASFIFWDIETGELAFFVTLLFFFGLAGNIIMIVAGLTAQKEDPLTVKLNELKKLYDEKMIDHAEYLTRKQKLIEQNII